MSAFPSISVVIPTHNPRMDYLRRVLHALRGQTLSKDLWELLIVDNGSRVPLRAAGPRGQDTKSRVLETARGEAEGKPRDREQESGVSPKINIVDLSWHANARVVREEELGLTFARLRGFAETTGELIVLVDDDNVLDPDYLEQTVKIAEEFPFLGSWSGQAVFEFEDSSVQPPEMLRGLLLERHLDRDCWSNDRHHTKSDPYGAGMCVRRVVAEAYARKLASEPKRMELDLSGGELLYGGDLDLAFAGLDIGLGKGAFHRLKFTHLIPKSRCSMAYLMRAAEGHAYSEVIAAWLNGDRPPHRDSTVRRSAAGPSGRRAEA
jgi:glycosyltransferase involved in cell wall biosynthesis